MRLTARALPSGWRSAWQATPVTPRGLLKSATSARNPVIRCPVHGKEKRGPPHPLPNTARPTNKVDSARTAQCEPGKCDCAAYGQGVARGALEKVVRIRGREVAGP
eukprot:365820-Pleurochrysis_carterae.AAC.2